MVKHKIIDGHFSIEHSRFDKNYIPPNVGDKINIHPFSSKRKFEVIKVKRVTKFASPYDLIRTEARIEVTWKEFCEILMEHSSFADLMERFLFWHLKYTPSFSDHLYDLMVHADAHNFLKIRKGFSLECLIFSLWNNNCKDIADFFNSFNIGHIIEGIEDRVRSK